MTVAPTPVSWRRLVLPVYGPTLLVSVGYGAIVPLVALSARALGASVGTAALVVGLIGVGQLVGDLPAGALAARVGEKRALIGACLLDALALLGAFLARDLVVLAGAVFVTGLAAAVVHLARHAYLTETIPADFRARALSTLGGTFRIGLFVGPVVGAAIVAQGTLTGAYGFAAVMSLAAAALTTLLPDLGPRSRAGRGARTPQATVVSVLARHRRVLLTVGGGVLVISAARAARHSILPLWADSQGLDATTISLIFGLSAAVDVLLFYPGGAIMDRYGRVFVAVPTMLVLGLGFLLLPLSSTPATIAAVAALMGLGNGVSAGIVLTLGADASPEEGRAQFLGGWRLCSDLGNAGGPLVISAVAALGPLSLAAVVMAALTWAGAGWLARWVPRRRPASSRPRSGPLEPARER